MNLFDDIKQNSNLFTVTSMYNYYLYVCVFKRESFDVDVAALNTVSVFWLFCYSFSFIQMSLFMNKSQSWKLSTLCWT